MCKVFRLNEKFRQPLVMQHVFSLCIHMYLTPGLKGQRFAGLRSFLLICVVFETSVLWAFVTTAKFGFGPLEIEFYVEFNGMVVLHRS